jgi:hypothetical protein
MRISRRFRRAVPVVVVCLLAAPSVAQAYQVTVNVHGAGSIDETTPANLLNCTTPGGSSESTVTACTGGTPSGDYAWGWTVTLVAGVPASYHDRGWRFLKWVDSSSAGKVNCDPQDTTGDHTSATCTFATFDNLSIDAYFDDIEGPQDTSVSGGPSGPTSSTGATFGFNAVSDPDASFDCRLDRPSGAGSWFACGSPLDKSESFSGLTTSGSYTFYVRGRDPSGNVDATPASWTWTVDTTPPTTSIAGGPAQGSTTKDTTAGFSLDASEAATFQCKIDRPGIPGTFGSCISTPSYSNLTTNGTYTFQARAVDNVGNLGPVTVRSWTVDTQPPDTLIDSGPSGETNSTAATFGFSATEAGTSFECKLDGGPWESCTSGKTYSSLATGSHTFYVRGTDQVGNVEASEASRTWTITVPPITQPGGTPSGGTPSGGTPSGGTPSGGTPDTAGPVAVLSFARQRLARALRRGLAGSGSSAEAGTLVLDVLYRGKKVATSGKRALTQAGALKLVAKFTRKGKRTLGRMRSARLTLRLTATDAAGNVTVKKKTVKLKR